MCDADVDLLQSLVDKSLPRHSAERFWMLETIREFALERLEESGEAEEVRRKHAELFLELAQLAQPELRGPSSSTWHDRLEAEHDNIHAVLDEALEHGRSDVALRLGGAIWHFWWTRGYWSEGRRWLETALAAETESDLQVRSGALVGPGMLALWQGDAVRGTAVADHLLALAETDPARAWALLFAGLAASRSGDEDRAADLWEESARLAREQRDSQLLGMTLNNLGSGAFGRGEYERALELYEESLAIGRELQDQDRLARVFGNLGFTTLLLGDVERARSLFRDGLVAAREIGLVEGFIGGFVGLGTVCARDDPARAARLLGRADLLSEEAGLDPEEMEDRIRDEMETELRARLGEDAYAALHAEGRALTLEDALALALRPD